MTGAAAPTPAELDEIGRVLGFTVSARGLWRREGWVIVLRLKSREADDENDLPAHVAVLEADGRIDADDVVRAFYVYEEDTTAMKRLFRAIVDDRRARHRPFLLSVDTLRHLGHEVSAERMSQSDAWAVLFAPPTSSEIAPF